MSDLDPFADAFAEIAEQSHHEARDITVEWLRAFMAEDIDGPIPDVLILTRQSSDRSTWAMSFHNNGATYERCVYLVELFKHRIMFEDEGE